MPAIDEQQYAKLASELEAIKKLISFQNDFITLTQYSNCRNSNGRKVRVSKGSIAHYRDTDDCHTLVNFKGGSHLFFHETPNQIDRLIQGVQQ